MLEPVVHAVGDGTVVVEAGEDFLDLVHDIVGTGDVEERLLLAGEAGIRQVFGGRGGTHGHGHVAAAVLGAELRVGATDVGIQIRLQGRVDHPGADFLAGRGQGGHVFHVQRGQLVEDALGEVVVGDERLERLGRGRVAAGHRDAQVGQVADHLAQRRILAAHAGQVGQAQLVQPQDVLVQAHCSEMDRTAPRTAGVGPCLGGRSDMMQCIPIADKLDLTGVSMVKQGESGHV